MPMLSNTVSNIQPSTGKSKQILQYKMCEQYDRNFEPGKFEKGWNNEEGSEFIYNDNLQCVWKKSRTENEISSKISDELLQLRMQWEGERRGMEKMGESWGGNIQLTGNPKEKSELQRKEWGLEGWDNLQTKRWLLFQRKNKIRKMPRRVQKYVKKGRVYNGVSTEYGNGDWKITDTNGMCTSHRPQSGKQRYKQSNVIQKQFRPQEIRSGASYTTTLATVTKEQYTGIIFCPTVSTGAFVARRNGRIFLTGNSGFPKSMDISKQIDKKLGAQREVISMRTDGNKGGGTKVFDDDDYIWDKPFPVTEATSDKAKQWSGWGTALKPAVEPVVMARKPLSEPTVADNVLKYGTGGINIDESRIPTGDELGRDFTNGKSDIFGGGSGIPGSVTSGNSNGRFPANLIIDEEAGKLLDEQSGLDRGQKGVVSGNEPSHTKKNAIYGDYSMVSGKYAEPKDSGGGASRFFYCPKTSKSDRNEGLDLFEDRPSYMVENGSKTSGVSGERYERATIQKNNHPTVKPTDLMLYLIRLVTPKGGTTLDPFMGSGSTGKAAVRGGFGFIGMELEEEYFEIAEARIKWESDKPKTITTSKTKKDDVLTNPETIETLNKFFGE
jgi:site-specific DNA-methyltransferase (adenine-specific)